MTNEKKSEKYEETKSQSQSRSSSPSPLSLEDNDDAKPSGTGSVLNKLCCGNESGEINSTSSKEFLNDEKIGSFEDLLKICKTGRWQFQVFMLASFCGFLTAIHNLVYAFIGAKPDSWCQIPDVMNYTLETLKNFTIPLDEDGEFEMCLRFPATNGSSFWSDGQLDNNGNFPLDRGRTEQCTNISFDKSIFESTIVTDYDLACGKEALGSLVQATYMFGILFGSPIFGAISDRIGRKKTITIASIIFILDGPLVALAPNYICLMIARFILGASSPGIYGTSFVLAVEVVGTEWRGLVGNLFCLPFALGYMVLPGVAYFFRSWKTLQLVLSIPPILQLLVCWYIPESPRWLLRKGRIEEAEKLLREMAETNKIESLPINFSESIAKIADVEKEPVIDKKWTKQLAAILGGYTALMRSPKLRLRTLVIYISWMSISLVYYGIALNSPNLSADRYWYTFISGVLEVPSYFMVPPLIRFFGRRKIFCGLLLLCSCSLLLSLLFSAGSAMIVVLAMGGKLMIGSAYALVYLYATEIMPTLLRTYGVGTASMVGRIGSVSAPFIVDVIGRDNKTYPTIVFGTVSLLAGLLAMLLPETKGKRLPETVRDVEESNT